MLRQMNDLCLSQANVLTRVFTWLINMITADAAYQLLQTKPSTDQQQLIRQVWNNGAMEKGKNKDILALALPLQSIPASAEGLKKHLEQRSKPCESMNAAFYIDLCTKARRQQWSKRLSVWLESGSL